jgi:hypothetical protein
MKKRLRAPLLKHRHFDAAETKTLRELQRVRVQPGLMGGDDGLPEGAWAGGHGNHHVFRFAHADAHEPNLPDEHERNQSQ